MISQKPHKQHKFENLSWAPTKVTTAATQHMLKRGFERLPYDWWKEHVGEEGEVERWVYGGGDKRYAWALWPVCFRWVLKDYPFISAHILVSVVTQREAASILCCWGLQRIMRCSLSGLTDNTFRDPCL